MISNQRIGRALEVRHQAHRGNTGCTADSSGKSHVDKECVAFTQNRYAAFSRSRTIEVGFGGTQEDLRVGAHTHGCRSGHRQGDRELHEIIVCFGINKDVARTFKYGAALRQCLYVFIQHHDHDGGTHARGTRRAQASGDIQ